MVRAVSRWAVCCCHSVAYHYVVHRVANGQGWRTARPRPCAQRITDRRDALRLQQRKEGMNVRVVSLRRLGFAAERALRARRTRPGSASTRTATRSSSPASGFRRPTGPR